MEKITPSYSNFVLYGSQGSEKANQAYQKVFNQLQAKLKDLNINCFIANPQNLELLLQNLMGPTIFFPLFLMEGIEYQTFVSKITHNFKDNYRKFIVEPLSEFEIFLNCLFKGNKNTIFLMHGSSQYDNVSRHTKIIKYGEKLGFQNFCFLEGTNSYKDLIQTKIVAKETIEISPLFFILGKHIQSDIINGILAAYPKEKWSLQPCLLDREEIIKVILEIAKIELQL